MPCVSGTHSWSAWTGHWKTGFSFRGQKAKKENMRQAEDDHPGCQAPAHSLPCTPWLYYPLLLPHGYTALVVKVGWMDFCRSLSQSQGRWKSPDLGGEKEVPSKLFPSREARDNNLDTTQSCLCIAASRGTDSCAFSPHMKAKGNVWIPTASYFSPWGNILLLLPLQCEVIYCTATHRDIGDGFLKKSSLA